MLGTETLIYEEDAIIWDDLIKAIYYEDLTGKKVDEGTNNIVRTSYPVGI